MPAATTDTNKQIIFIIIAVVSILLFLGVLFLQMLLYYQRRKRKYHQEKQLLEAKYTQQLLQSQLEIQEQTFNIISQEIHDNVGQALSLAKMQLNILEQGNTPNKALINDTKETIGKAIADLRDIAKSLNTDRIEQSGFSTIIDYELARIDRSGYIHARLYVRGKEQTIESRKKLIIYRITQEALQNILKHSGATEIIVNLEYDDDCLRISINDNGKGFDLNTNKKDGLGLQNMISRAALIGGSAAIESKTDVGTTIKLTAPYN